MQITDNSPVQEYPLLPSKCPLTKIENCPSTESKSPPELHVTKVCLLLRVTNSRTKTLIADQLPTKTDKVVFCPLTDTQREAYENLMECEDIQLIKRRSEKCDCGSNLTRGGCCYSTTAEGARIESLIFPYHPPHPWFDSDGRYMMYVQKLSNHLALLMPRILPQ